MLPSCGAYILYGWAKWLLLRVRVFLFSASLGRESLLFHHIFELVQERGTFNSYDKSLFIHQSFLSHMNVLLPITF
jgi:hypothetical protein